MNVLQRIARHRHQVGQLPGRDLTPIVQPQELCRVERRGTERLERGHAAIHQCAELMGILSMGIHRRVSSEGDPHAGPDGPAEILLGQRQQGLRLGPDRGRQGAEVDAIGQVGGGDQEGALLLHERDGLDR